jgi:hypothetical protein
MEDKKWCRDNNEAAEIISGFIERKECFLPDEGKGYPNETVTVDGCVSTYRVYDFTVAQYTGEILTVHRPYPIKRGMYKKAVRLRLREIFVQLKLKTTTYHGISPYLDLYDFYYISMVRYQYPLIINVLENKVLNEIDYTLIFAALMRSRSLYSLAMHLRNCHDHGIPVPFEVIRSLQSRVVNKILPHAIREYDMILMKDAFKLLPGPLSEIDCEALAQKLETYLVTQHDGDSAFFLGEEAKKVNHMRVRDVLEISGMCGLANKFSDSVREELERVANRSAALQ